MPSVILWLERNGDWLRSLAAIVGIVGAIGGGIFWAASLQSKVDTLQGQVSYLMTTPLNHGASSQQAPNAHDQMCANLAAKLADAYANPESTTFAIGGIEEEMKTVGCTSSK